MVSKAMAKKAIVISLIALAITICGAVLTFLIHYIYDDIYDVSLINIVIVRDKDNPLTTITKITHNGEEAAKNLYFTLRTPGEITKNSSFTSVKNMNLQKSAPNVLTAFVPKFGPGPGSIIEIYTTIKGSQTNATTTGAGIATNGPEGYSAHAVYDQGSITRE